MNCSDTLIGKTILNALMISRVLVFCSRGGATPKDAESLPAAILGFRAKFSPSQIHPVYQVFYYILLQLEYPLFKAGRVQLRHQVAEDFVLH